MNYIIDERFKVNKGLNAVIPMIDDCLPKFVPPGSQLIFYCDNHRLGQNKNQRSY